MTQSTFFVNCPHCGKIVEVVCPRINAEPKKVIAQSDYFWFQDERIHNTMTCPSCENKLTLYWYF